MPSEDYDAAEWLAVRVLQKRQELPDVMAEDAKTVLASLGWSQIQIDLAAGNIVPL